MAFSAGILSLVVALILSLWVSRQKVENRTMEDIAKAIRVGSTAYLKRQYKTISIISVILAILLYLVFGLKTSLAFLIGAVFSLLAGYVGMDVATKANAKGIATIVT